MDTEGDKKGVLYFVLFEDGLVASESFGRVESNIPAVRCRVLSVVLRNVSPAKERCFPVVPIIRPSSLHSQERLARCPQLFTLASTLSSPLLVAAHFGDGWLTALREGQREEAMEHCTVLYCAGRAAA